MLRNIIYAWGTFAAICFLPICRILEIDDVSKCSRPNMYGACTCETTMCRQLSFFTNDLCQLFWRWGWNARLRKTRQPCNKNTELRCQAQNPEFAQHAHYRAPWLDHSPPVAHTCFGSQRTVAPRDRTGGSPLLMKAFDRLLSRMSAGMSLTCWRSSAQYENGT